MITLCLIAGLVALVIGAELLVRGASQLAISFGIPSLVVGLTVVAFGTSAPELAVSVSSALAGKADLALGNVVGSNIYNVLFILGISALIVPLVVDQKLIRFDVPLLLGISVLVLCFSLDANINRIEGGMLFLGLVSYTAWCIVAGRKESQQVQLEYEIALGVSETAPVPQNKSQSTQQVLWQIGLISFGLCLLVLGANWFVNGATQLAHKVGLSDLFIGLTIVAGGTSLPEAATSIVAALRGERDIAVGNIIGSNIFNLLGVLGLSALISPQGVGVAPQAIQFDLPVMVAVSAACLPVFFTGHLIARWEGALFVGYAIAYTATLLLKASNSETLPVFQLLMCGFVIPVTFITLLVIVARTRSKESWG